MSTQSQKRVASFLTDLLYLFRQQHPSDDGSVYQWNEATWQSIIKRCSGTIANDITSLTRDCWLSDAKADRDGYPRLKVVKLVQETRANQGTRYFKDQTTKEFGTRMYRVLFALAHPEQLANLQSHARDFQCAHRCHHNVQACVNPYHLILTSDAANKNMTRCFYGAAALCPHEPKCVFTDYTGRHLPCRNNPEIVLCTCRENCYSARIE